MDYGIAVLSGVIELIILGNDNAREAGASRESMPPNLRHPPRKVNAFNILATTEGIFSNLLHPFGQSDFR